MGVSPLRALTQPAGINALSGMNCRNGSKPVEGIDTNLVFSFFNVHFSVEMGVSPLRALTPCHAAACQKG